MISITEKSHFQNKKSDKIYAFQGTLGNYRKPLALIAKGFKEERGD